MSNTSTWAWVGGTASSITTSMVGTAVPLSGYNDTIVLNDANNDGLIGDLDGTALPKAGDGITVNGVFHQVAQMTAWTATFVMTDGTSHDIPMHVYRLDNNTLYFRIADSGIASLSAAGYYRQDIVSGSLSSPSQTAFNFENMAQPNYSDIFPLCFCKGTRIATAKGDIAVENITAGTMVWTLDSGLQPVRLLAESTFSARDLVGSENHLPVVIPAGALGNGLPVRDLAVSPQHRILINARPLSRCEGVDEVFVPAKKLIGHKGIRRAAPAGSVKYYHLVLDRHHAVLANGIYSESFLVSCRGMVASGRRRKPDTRSPSH